MTEIVNPVQHSDVDSAADQSSLSLSSPGYGNKWCQNYRQQNRPGARNCLLLRFLLQEAVWNQTLLWESSSRSKLATHNLRSVIRTGRCLVAFWWPELIWAEDSF